MRTAAATLMLVALGCSNPTPPGIPNTTTPQLRYQSFGVGDSVNPIQFGLRVSNGGTSPVEVDAVDVDMQHATVIGDVAGGGVPSSPQFLLKLLHPGLGGSAEPVRPGETVTLEPWKTTDLWLAVVWHLPDNPPPALALYMAVFQVKRVGQSLIESQPVTFLI